MPYQRPDFGSVCLCKRLFFKKLQNFIGVPEGLNVPDSGTVKLLDLLS